MLSDVQLVELALHADACRDSVGGGRPFDWRQGVPVLDWSAYGRWMHAMASLCRYVTAEGISVKVIADTLKARGDVFEPHALAAVLFAICSTPPVVDDPDAPALCAALKAFTDERRPTR